MKKLMLFALMVMAGLTASAQNYIGGSFGFTRDITGHETNFTVAPEIGYSYSDHWGVGVTLDYNYKNGAGYVSNGFSFAPYARWTFARVADDKLSFFLDGGFNFGFAKDRAISSTGVFYNIGFKPGISYAFNEHWSVVSHLGFLGYEGANHAGEDLGYHRKFGLDFTSMNLNLGFYYSF